MPEPKATTPDAILFPNAFRTGRSPVDRLRFVQDRLGPILGGADYVDFQSHPVHVRDVGSESWLATLDSGDTLLYPSGHPLEKQDRYTWMSKPNGLRFGYLKREAAGGGGSG